MYTRTASGIRAALPQHILRRLDPQVLLLVGTDPQEIAERRQRDSNGIRDQMLPEEFAVDTEWSRATPAPSAGATTALVKVIRNDMRKHEAAKELLEVIRSPMEGKN